MRKEVSAQHIFPCLRSFGVLIDKLYHVKLIKVNFLIIINNLYKILNEIKMDLQVASSRVSSPFNIASFVRLS